MNAKRKQRAGTLLLLLVKAFVLVVLYCALMLLLSRRVFLLGTTAGVSSSLRVSTTTNPSSHTRSSSRTRMSSSSSRSSSPTTMFDAHPIGLGTFMMDRDQVGTALPSAIAAGYRRIDCAPVYFNEDAVGDALAAAMTAVDDDEPGRVVVSRQELFVVSKLASPFHRNVEAAVRKTLLDLRLDYLDLYLGTYVHHQETKRTIYRHYHGHDECIVTEPGLPFFSYMANRLSFQCCCYSALARGLSTRPHRSYAARLGERRH